jgi:hypothetical protein
VDPRNVFPRPVSEGVVEMVSVLFTQVLRSRILRTTLVGVSKKFAYWGLHCLLGTGSP